MYTLCWTDGADPRKPAPYFGGPLWAARQGARGYGWVSSVTDAQPFTTFGAARAHAAANDWPFSSGMLFILHHIREKGKSIRRIVYRRKVTTGCSACPEDFSTFRGELA